jgi:hypothetical protein
MKAQQIPYRIPEDRHREFTSAIKEDGLSVQEFMDKAVDAYLVERRAYARFELRAARGNPEHARKVLSTIRKRIEGKSSRSV